MSMTILISKLLPLFVTSDKRQVHQVDISSSLDKLSPSSSSASSLSEPLSLSSSDSVGDGEEATVQPPMIAYRRVIRPTWVFTYHNSSLRVSKQASMYKNCAMMASSVTSLIVDEGAKVDGVVETRGVTVSVRGRLGMSCASLHWMIATSMAHITIKWGDSRKETEKWWRSRVIAEGKISLLRVAISLKISISNRMKWEGKSIEISSKRDRKIEHEVL